MSDDFVDPFKLWSEGNADAPKEDEQHEYEPYTEEEVDGEIKIVVHPSVIARQSAAIVAGQFRALQDTGEFSREEAFRIVLKSMNAVIIHHGDHDDDDE